MNKEELADLADVIFYKEVVREQLREVGAPTDDEFVDQMWEKCHGNPWNAAALYILMTQANNALDPTKQPV